MANVSITTDALNQDSVASFVASPAYGAVVTFIGNVRDNARGMRVHYLVYEAYLPLAEKELAAIAHAAEQRWNVACAIAHRIGRVDIGETSVVIAVASPHRADAFEACRWLMDTLKESVPIWKKEYYESGEHWIEGSDVVPSGDTTLT